PTLSPTRGGYTFGISYGGGHDAHRTVSLSAAYVPLRRRTPHGPSGQRLDGAGGPQPSLWTLQRAADLPHDRASLPRPRATGRRSSARCRPRHDSEAWGVPSSLGGGLHRQNRSHRFRVRLGRRDGRTDPSPPPSSLSSLGEASDEPLGGDPDGLALAANA